VHAERALVARVSGAALERADRTTQGVERRGEERVGVAVASARRTEAFL
jgi:hypothetical protein